MSITRRSARFWLLVSKVLLVALLSFTAFVSLSSRPAYCQHQQATGEIASPPQPEQLGSISGKVTDLTSGSPVTDGWVLARKLGGGAEAFGSRLQPDGSYRIHRLEAGSYTVFLQSPHYAFTVYTPRSGQAASGPGAVATKLTVIAGKNLDGIDMRAPRLATVFGRILDEAGKPLHAVRVVLLTPGSNPDQPIMVPASVALTNDLGEYRVRVQPGQYLLSVNPQSGGPHGNIVDRTDPLVDRPLPAYDTTYYPGVPEQLQATPMNLAPGEERYGVDVILTALGGYTVSGRVLRPDGSPATQCTIRFQRITDRTTAMLGMNFVGVNSRDGSFVRTGVSDGNYRLVGGDRSGEEPLYLNESITVQGEDVSDLVVRLRPGVTVTGSVRFEGKPHTVAEDGPTQSRVYLQPADAEQQLIWQSNSVALMSQDLGILDERNEFRIANMPPLRYLVGTRLAGGYYASKVYSGSEDITTTGIDLSRSASSVQLQIIASGDGGSVSGSTLDSEGNVQGGLLVTLYPTGAHEGRADLRKNGVSDQQGQFHLHTVPPGDYVLIAYEDGPQIRGLLPTLLSRMKERGQRIRVAPRQQVQVQTEMLRVQDFR